LVIDDEEQWVTTSVIMPNNSSRSVRMTAIELDAPGAVLVESGVVVERRDETQRVDVDGDFAMDTVSEAMSPEEFFAPEFLPLPVTIEPGDYARVFVRFRPNDCANAVDPIGTWGVALLSLDFGDGGFPPFTRTIRLTDDPIIANGEGPQLTRDDVTIVNITAAGEQLDPGILTAICAELS